MEVLFLNSPLAVRRGSSTGWSFSKEPRFRSTRRNTEIDFIDPSSTLSPRSTSIGFGQRWKPEIQSSKGMPPPGSYDIPSTFSSKVGPKIVKTSVAPLSALRKVTPGPGSYENNVDLGKKSPKFSFRMKVGMAKLVDGPGPTEYYPKRTLTEFSGYQKIGFGFGNRNFPILSCRDSPGPGSYTLGSDFDKCKRG